MWALRRAAYPVRRTRCAVAPPACAGVLDIASCMPEAETRCYGNELRRAKPGGALQQPSYSCGPSFVPKFSFGGRSLSSHAGERPSDNEDELEDGFSDLEVPPEVDGGDDVVGNGSDGEVIETANKPEKGSERKTFMFSLLKVIMDAPRQSLSGVLDKWVEEDNALGRSEISTALLQLRKRRLYGKALQFVEWLEAKKRIDFLEQDYASHLDLVAKVHGLQRAEKFIDAIPKPMRGELAYRTLLANCVSMGDIKKAEEVFNKIKDLGFEVSSFACNQLLLLYKRVDRKKIADVLLLMEKENINPSLFTYKILIDTKGRFNDIQGMEQIVEMMKSNGIEPDLVVQATLARHYINASLNEKAEAIVKEMEGTDIVSNRNACKALLPLYAALGKVEDVGRIWEVCRETPRMDECLAAIEAWGKLNRVEDAEKVFENILTNWKRTASKCYNALLKVYAQHKLLYKGKELAKKMEDSGCRIGPLTLDALVRLYVESGEVKKADSILHKASEQKYIRLLYNTYLVVLDQYAKQGDIHNAEKMFNTLKLNGYGGRLRQYQALLQAYINAKAPAYGFRERMMADNLFPNKTSVALLASADAFTKTGISELLD